MKKTEIDDLFNNYQSGDLLDWPRLAHWDNKSVHTGAESFFINQEIVVPKIAYSGSVFKVANSKNSILILNVRITASKIMIVIWETLRKYLPEKIRLRLRWIVKQVNKP